jgi:hypothetical protein
LFIEKCSDAAVRKLLKAVKLLVMTLDYFSLLIQIVQILKKILMRRKIIYNLLLQMRVTVETKVLNGEPPEMEVVP